MSIAPTRMYPEINFEYDEYAIGGKMIVASTQVDAAEELQMNDYDRSKLRTKLVEELADAMLSTKLVEITKLTDPTTYITTIKARCYLAPDSTVKLLRTLKK